MPNPKHKDVSWQENWRYWGELDSVTRSEACLTFSSAGFSIVNMFRQSSSPAFCRFLPVLSRLESTPGCRKLSLSVQRTAVIVISIAKNWGFPLHYCQVRIQTFFFTHWPHWSDLTTTDFFSTRLYGQILMIPTCVPSFLDRVLQHPFRFVVCIVCSAVL